MRLVGVHFRSLVRRPRGAPGFTYWKPLLFLGCFTGLLIFLTSIYLVPAMDAYRVGTPMERRQIDAYSTLLLTVVLLILLSGLILTFRIGRFFFPRDLPKRTKTKYVDVWTEAGRRLEVPPRDEKLDGQG